MQVPAHGSDIIVAAELLLICNLPPQVPTCGFSGPPPGLCCCYSETAPWDQREDSEPIPRPCCDCMLSFGPKQPPHPVVPGPALLYLATTIPPELLRGARDSQSDFTEQPVSARQTPVPADPGTVVVPHTRDPRTPPHYCSEGQ